MHKPTPEEIERCIAEEKLEVWSDPKTGKRQHFIATHRKAPGLYHFFGMDFHAEEMRSIARYVDLHREQIEEEADSL